MRTVPVLHPDRQETTGDHLETLALCAAYRCAMTAYPETERMRKGLRLALDGHVQLHEDGTALVLSQHTSSVYTVVQGTCDCPDPEPQCKHRWSKALLKKARTLLTLAVALALGDQYGEQCPACGFLTVVQVPVWGKHSQSYAYDRRCQMVLDDGRERYACGWRAMVGEETHEAGG